MTLAGPGAGSLEINAANSTGSVFIVDAGIVAEIDGAVITGGVGAQSTIWNFGTLTVSGSTIIGNATLSGANEIGILSYNGCEVSLAGTTISGFLGAGMENFGVAALTDSAVSGNKGGGIYSGNFSSLTLTDSTISGNSDYVAAGGLSLGQRSVTEVVDSTISGNAGGSYGGGIYDGGGISLSVTDSTISGNKSSGPGGGIYFSLLNFSAAKLALTDCTVVGNSAAEYGGGIYTASYGSAIPSTEPSSPETLAETSPTGG